MADYEMVMVADDAGRMVYPLPEASVDPVMVWEAGTDGKKRPTDHQDRDAATGLPLWETTAMIRVRHFNRVKPQMVTVRWAAEDATSGAPL